LGLKSSPLLPGFLPFENGENLCNTLMRLVCDLVLQLLWRKIRQGNPSSKGKTKIVPGNPAKPKDYNMHRPLP
jgi:hypothetical protein